MKLFCILGVFLHLSVVQLEATSVSQFACIKRNLTVNADDYLRLYLDGIEITGLPNANIHNQADVVDLPCNTRLIATKGKNKYVDGAAGILASTDDEYVLTNSTWKCSNVSHVGWETIDFDDSAWKPGVDLGRNGNSTLVFIPGISLNAVWIWLRTWDGQEMDIDVYCRKRLDPSICTYNPCAFGGICIEESNGGYQCICVPGYTGQNCSSAINFCESDPCVNGGSCEPIVNGYVCQCQPGYTDDNCEEVTNNCASFPCLNGGTCLNGINYFVCVCPPESTGVRCQTVIGACDPNPCLNGGTCNNLGGDSFTCTCDIYWTGLKCESPNYNEAFACGTSMTWSEYNATNGFTRLCQYWQPLGSSDRNTECRHTIKGIPLYDDYVGLMNAGGNFGCVVSQDYPDDLPATSYLSCQDNYQQYVSLSNVTESERLMVCIRYPYEGVPGRE